MGIFTLVNGDSPQVDGEHPLETLWLEFDHKVKLLGSAFTSVGHNDDFKLLVDDYELLTGKIPGGNPSDSGFGITDLSSYGSDIQGYKFGFTVNSPEDDYSLYAVEVEKVPVPEPTVVLGLLAVLGAGSTLKQKKIAS